MKIHPSTFVPSFDSINASRLSDKYLTEFELSGVSSCSSRRAGTGGPGGVGGCAAVVGAVGKADPGRGGGAESTRAKLAEE